MIYDNLLTMPGLTYSRAGAGTAVAADGSVVSFAANVPRITSKGILIEEPRTNLLLRSQEFDQSPWVPSRATVTANAGIAPDGTTTADLLTEDTNSGTHRVYQTVTKAASAVQYSATVYIKAAGRNFAQIRLAGTGESTAVSVPVNLLTGDIGASYLTNVGWTGVTVASTLLANGWVRVHLVATSDTSTSVGLFIMPATDIIASSPGHTGNGLAAIMVWGAQLEAGASATSYIPTTTAAATRTLDTLSSTVSILPSQDFVIFAEIALSGVSPVQQRIFELDSGSSVNRLVTYRSSNGNVLTSITVASVGQNSAQVAKVGARTLKVAIRRIGSSYQMFLDGVASAAVVAANMPTLTVLFDGQGRAGATPANDYITKRILAMGTFSDAACINLTT
jgi:hypothetical protein